jgi:hypothetical protein
MSTERSKYIEEVLPDIDRALSQTPLGQRPLLAAIEFVRCCVETVNDGGVVRVGEEATEFVGTRWFAVVFSEVESWYHRRHGAGAFTAQDHVWTGLLVFAENAFKMAIPTMTFRPGTRPDKVTSWMSFPDHVLDDEVATDWIENSPDLATFAAEEQKDARSGAVRVAGYVRAINSRTTGIPIESDGLDGLLRGIRLRLEHASRLVADDQRNIQPAYWEIQIACENALKALHLVRAGEFRTVHDLVILFDAIPNPKPNFSRQLLLDWPHWKEMTNLRYGQGDRNDLSEFYSFYLVALEIVSECLKPMAKLQLGKASFEIGRAPWLNKSSQNSEEI